MPTPTRIPKETRTPASQETPWIARWLIHTRPSKRGLFINLPIVDTDPNRGVTSGVMPIWVFQGEDEDRVRHIHAPSLTYNANFGVIPTYRYYFYPAADASLAVRGSVSTLAEREAVCEFESRSFSSRDISFFLRGHYNVDGANRFFGLGPNSDQDSESDYTEDVLQYHASAGAAIAPETRWTAHVANHLASKKIYAGKIDGLPDISRAFPTFVPLRHQQSNETKFIMDYDSRDNATATTEGSYLQTYAGGSIRGLASSFDYSRYGLDGRYFYRWPTSGRRKVTAAQFRYEQLFGSAPFWLLPRIGGKYNLRAYGEGRYLDRGSMLYSIEQRFTIMEKRMAGVTTEFELDPFLGLGTVFDNPGRLAARYARPVVGAAIRAVARPQVVGSIDFGVGQEGPAVFMDINYSF